MRSLTIAALLCLPLLPLTGCGGPARPDPAALAAYGAFDLERYFLGRTKAWGLFEPRFGGAVRQFTVEITGTRQGDALVLDEDFTFSDGERERRVWRITRTAGGYEGRTEDVAGFATGVSLGNGLNWRYDIRLKTKDGGIDVHFDDWLYRFDDEMMLNRAEVRKFGLAVGSVTLAFRKIS